MADIVIRAEMLGKKFVIGTAQPRYRTLRESLVKVATGPLRAGRRILSEGFRQIDKEEVWALRDISFEIRQGDVVGVIGRNGAGKSTLLKVLSRITDPNSGFADVYGRIGSLLEVGTGFHPELTGRENIFLNAAILGMKRKDILKKFDEMVEFAEIQKFIDTPVKFYSSGMYLRLAFAVAAHLEPDILLVDEILAVGDAAFQSKCLGKMGDVARQGRTILFVSHNMGQIRRLCRYGFWINQGVLVKNGSIVDVVGAYQQDQKRVAESTLTKENQSSREYGFLSWRILGSSDSECNLLTDAGSFEMEILLNTQRSISKAHYKLILISSEGQRIAGWCMPSVSLDAGLHRFIHRFAGLPVHPGVYNWYVALWEAASRIDEVHFTPDLVVGTLDHSGLSEEWAGIVNTPCNISIETS